MLKKLIRALQGLCVAIPLSFILVSVVSNCSGISDCSGTVTLDNEADCSTYAIANDCADFNFSGGVCNVTNCGDCEEFVDDGDPVIDVDDGGFIADDF